MRPVDAYPLTMLQAGMLFHSWHGGGRSTYQDILGVDVDGPLDLTVLESAVDTAVARHPTLRTGFDLITFSEPMQLVYEDVDSSLTVDDLRAMDGEAQRQVLDRWWEEQKRDRIDWTRPPLARFHVHRLADQRHRIGLTFHHAILDGWSLASLVAEVIGHCQSEVDAVAAAPAPRASIRDYVALERRALTAPATRQYWAETLRDRPVNRIPRWRARGQGDHGTIAARVPGDTVAALHELGGALGVPLRSVILTAHLAVLALVTGERDVCTGLVTNGRPETVDGDRVLGLFLNTVPFHVELLRSSWRAAIRAVYAEETRMAPHRRYPLAQIHRDLGAQGQSLFDVAFDFRHFHVYESLADGGETALSSGRFFERNNFPLTVNANASDRGLELRLVHDPREFPTAQVERLRDYHLAALAAMVGRGDSPVRPGDLLSPTERHALLSTWRGAVDGAADPLQPVDQLVADTVAREPARPAVHAGDTSLTYQELWARVESLAARLQAAGVVRGTLVGICLDRSADLVTGVLAVLTAGAAYVPLDPRYPAHRLAFMVDDARIPVLLTQSSLAGVVPPGVAETVLVDDTTTAGDTRFRSPERHPDDLAYVIYTSGSTGRPKGVMVTHRAVVNLVRSMIVETDADADDTVLATTSLSFDIAALELFLPLLIGARLVVVDDVLTDPARLLTGLPAPPTLMQATPSAWRQILSRQTRWPATMKVLCGGESLPADLASALTARFDTVWNVYGPTETTIWSSATRLTAQPGTPTIGVPVRDTRLYVLDRQLCPAPEGTAGELYIGGVGLARGYLLRPGLTGERFVPDPFGTEPGARLYLTGDLVRVGADAEIEFVGRLDQQVKLRGHRIELAEVEAAIHAHPAVADAVVTLQDDGQDDRMLVAHLVLDELSEVPGDLRERVAATVPSYMVPTAFAVLPALPSTPNGKVDRGALPRVGRSRPAAAPRPVEPRDDLERGLAAIWAQTLGLAKVSVHDEFFDLGGDSLLALRILARVRAEMATEVPAAVLVEAGTVAAMAERVRAGTGPGAAPLVRMHDGGGRSPVVCVHPLGGHVFCYRELARHLGGHGHPFLAMQAPGLDSGEPLPSVPALAAHYLRAVREVRPQGPYLLAGWCMGGTVAFEMAGQLLAAGETVELLAMISTNATAPVPEAYAHDDAQLLLDVVYGGRLALSPDDLAGMPADTMLEEVFAEATASPHARQDIDDLARLRRVANLYRTNARALLAYRPRRLAVDAVLYRPSEGHHGSPPDLGWAPLVDRRLEVETLVGTHYSLLSGATGENLAERIATRAAKATSTRPGRQ